MTRAEDDPVWPALPYAEWKLTLTTLHMWLQVVGKVKLELTPFLNDWWNVAFVVNARGLSTSTIPISQRVFQVDLDFIDHRLPSDVAPLNEVDEASLESFPANDAPAWIRERI